MLLYFSEIFIKAALKHVKMLKVQYMTTILFNSNSNIIIHGGKLENKQIQ